MSRPTLSAEDRAAKKAELDLLGQPKRQYNRKPGAVPGAETETAEIPEEKGTPGSATEGASAPEKKFRPFAGSRHNRTYSNPTADLSMLNVSIPEAPGAEHMQGSVNARDILLNGSRPKGPEPTTQQINSQALGTQTLKPLEQKEAAERAAEGTIDGYAQVWDWVGMAAQVSEAKLSGLHAENRINMHSMFIDPSQDARGRGQTVKEFADDFNKQLKDGLTVSNEFKKKALPPLTNIYMRAGIGMSDEMYLAQLVIKDASSKGIMVYRMSSIWKGALKYLENNHSQMQQLAAKIAEDRMEIERMRAQVQANNNQPQNTQPQYTPQQPVAEPEVVQPETKAPPENENTGVALMVPTAEEGN